MEATECHARQTLLVIKDAAGQRGNVGIRNDKSIDLKELWKWRLLLIETAREMNVVLSILKPFKTMQDSNGNIRRKTIF